MRNHGAMLVSILLLGSACLAAWLVLQRALQEGDRWCQFALAPLLGCQWIVLGANFLPHSQRGWLIAAFALALLLLLRPAPETRPWRLCRPVAYGLGLGSFFATAFTHYQQIRFVDTDNWIHEPMIASYMRGIFPPVHPFFPEIPMNGHYGRDLLMAFLTPPLSDPLGTVWVLNLLLQLSAFVGLFAVARRFSERSGEALGLAACVFFGICVGFRTGMMDTFDGNNGAVYALLVGQLYLLGRLLELAGPSQGSTRIALWLVSAVTLGAYQLVYESHFGLLFLTGLSGALALRSRPRVWAGLVLVAVLALALACVEGGPFTDIARRRLQGQGPLSEASQNQGQHVSISFPKANLGKVMVSTADYQRLSAAYKTRLFSGIKPSIRGEGYMAVWDPQFLYAHWLPLYLSPLTLVWLWRRRFQDGAPGLLLWFFGAWAYFIPALVDFGALYEWEYFRWEFAAGWGWAGALGFTLCGLLRQNLLQRPIQLERANGAWTLRLGPGWLGCLVVVGLLVSELAAGEKLLNDAFVDAQRGLRWFPSPVAWRVAQKELGVTDADAQAAAWIAPQVKPHDRILTNLGDETPLGLWPDSVWATWTGALPAGRAHPPQDSRHHAHPNFYRDPLSKTLAAQPSLKRVALAGIRWLVVDPKRLPPQADWEGQAKAKFGSGDQQRWVFELPLERTSAPSVALAPVRVELQAPPQELRRGLRYPVRIEWAQPVQGRLESGLQGHSDRLRDDIQGIKTWETSLVTPWEEGEATWLLTSGNQTLAQLPFKVDIQKRLEKVQARLDLPDSFAPKRFYQLRLGLKSAVAIHAGHEFTVAWRLREQGGDYLWDLDSIPQEIELDLEPDQERLYELQLLTPARHGVYLPEIVLKDKRTGVETRLQCASGPMRI